MLSSGLEYDFSHLKKLRAEKPSDAQKAPASMHSFGPSLKRLEEGVIFFHVSIVFSHS